MIPLPKLPKNVRDLGKSIVAKGFKKLPKVQKIANMVTLLATLVVLSKMLFDQNYDNAKYQYKGIEIVVYA